ncbi:uncharacterized protein [Asterias amurensis]|uniref:uncharacterized protein n=1 Tax=Asterias amurensis TaxID=7602 RepID=UPI003AB7C2E6
MNNLKFFALFSTSEKPLEIQKVVATAESDAGKFDGGQHDFEGSIPLPLPQFLLIFSVGDWPSDSHCKEMNAQIHLGKDLEPFYLGTLSKENRALCWQGVWRDDLYVRGVLMSDEGQPGLLLVTPSLEQKDSGQVRCSYQDLSSKTSTADVTFDPMDDFETSQTESQVMDLTLDVEPLRIRDNVSTGKSDTPNTKSRLRQRQTEVTPEVTPQLSRAPVISKSSRKKRKTDEDQSTPSPRGRAKRLQLKRTPASAKKESPAPCRTPSKANCDQVPSARWGHSMCSISNNQALVIGGQGEQQVLSKDSIWLLDTESKTWCVPGMTKIEANKPQNRMGHTAVYDPMVKCVYVFGGSKNLRWFNDVHVLDIESWRWSHVEAQGRAPTRAYHTSTIYRNEMFVFGGVYPNPDPEPDGCSDQLLIFNPASESWYEPLVTGKKPKPRSGHSATLLDDQLVIFGGWDAPECFNDVHCLDLTLFDYENIQVMGSPPCPRSWHASAAMPGKRIFIHGGFDGDMAMTDSFIFCLATCSWTQVYIPLPMTPCAGHTLITLNQKFRDDGGKDKENETIEDDRRQRLMIFGGGNNEGVFSNKLKTFKLELA